MHPLMDQWYKVPIISSPSIHTTAKVYRGQLFTLPIFCRYYEAKPDGKADINVDIQILDPKGDDTGANIVNIIGFKNEIIDPSIILLCEPTIQIGFDNTDMLGTYTLIATARDNVAKTTQTCQTTVELVDFQTGENFTSDLEYNNWVSNYYKHADPAPAIHGLLKFMPEIEKISFDHLGIIEFYRCVYKNSPFALSHLAKNFEKYTPEQKEKIVFISLVAESNSFHELIKKEPEQFGKCVAIANKIKELDTIAPVKRPYLIDMLWSEFYATGRFEPVLKLAKTLELVKYDQGIYDKISSKSIKLDKENMQQFLLEAALKATAISIINNCKNDNLVTNYCRYIIEHEEVDKSVKISLKSLLEKFSDEIKK